MISLKKFLPIKLYKNVRRNRTLKDKIVIATLHNKKLENVMTSYYANDGLIAACFIGSYDLVNYMISWGANDWNEGFIYAIKGNNQEIILCNFSNYIPGNIKI